MPSLATLPALVAFFVLVVLHAKTEAARDEARARAEVHARHQLRADARFLELPVPTTRAVPDHPYASDIDLTGPGSLVQRIDVSRTVPGERALVALLSEPVDRPTIELRQEGLRELAADLDEADPNLPGRARRLLGSRAHELAARDPLGEPHKWYALLELVADETQADSLQKRVTSLLETALEQGLVEDATIAASETQAEALWSLRDGISSAERARGPAVQHDISVPPEKMPAFIEEASAVLERQFAGTRAVAFGHLGDGNVHFHLRAPEGARGGEWEDADGKAISAAVHDLVTEWAGSISAEHGIGQMKRDELARLGDPASLTILRGVKQALDPLGIMNPGKLVPLASGTNAA